MNTMNSNVKSASASASSSSEVKKVTRKGRPIESKNGEKKQRIDEKKSKRIKRSKAEVKNNSGKSSSGPQSEGKGLNTANNSKLPNTKGNEHKGEAMQVGNSKISKRTLNNILKAESKVGPIRKKLRKKLAARRLHVCGVDGCGEEFSSKKTLSKHMTKHKTSLESESISDEESEVGSEESKTSTPPQYLLDANLLMDAIDLDHLRWLHNGGTLFNDKMIPVCYLMEELREDEPVFFKLTAKLFYGAVGKSKSQFRSSKGGMAIGFEVLQAGKDLVMGALNDCKSIVEAHHFDKYGDNIEFEVASPFKSDKKTNEETSSMFHNHVDGRGVAPWSDIDMFVSRLVGGKQVKTLIEDISEKRDLLTGDAIRVELYFCIPQVWVDRKDCKLHIKFILDRIVFFPDVDVSSSCGLAEKLSKKRKFGDW